MFRIWLVEYSFKGHLPGGRQHVRRRRDRGGPGERLRVSGDDAVSAFGPADPDSAEVEAALRLSRLRTTVRRQMPEVTLTGADGTTVAVALAERAGIAKAFTMAGFASPIGSAVYGNVLDQISLRVSGPSRPRLAHR